MFSFLIFLNAFFFSTTDSDFEEWEEFHGFEETYETFLGESLIGSREWIDYVKKYDPHLSLEPIDSDWHLLFDQYVQKESIVIDYGAKCGGRVLALAKKLGFDGRVFAFESEPTFFRGLFWNLVRNNIQNARIFCHTKNVNIDQLQLENISLICIDAKGRENVILKGAMKTIQTYKPILMINLLGGIVIDQSDRYIKEAFEQRIYEIHKMGYITRRIGNSSWYLALPSTNF